MENITSSKGWYHRGYLPHFDAHSLIQMVTYHLADSVPEKIAAFLEHQLQALPAEKRGTKRRKEVEALIDAGHGSCVLRQTRIAEMIVENWHHYDKQRYDLLAWVVMPNHVHVLVRIYQTQPLPKIVQSWKSYSAKRIREFTGGCGRVWHREYWDRFIRDEKHFNDAVAYIHQNPLKARLVTTAEEWPWSSIKQWC